MNKNALFTFVLIALSFGLSAHADRWNSANDPSIMDSNYDYQFSDLPTEGELATKPWSETYWATAKGGINLRWNQAHPQGFDYALHSREEVMQMSREQLATLSPSEKFDIYTGNYNYPLHAAIASFTSPHVADWKGMCDGWSMAAIQYAEPQPKDVTNPDGVVIPFGSSDIKGLLAYVAQFRSGTKVNYVGGQCHGLAHFFGSDNCSDMNPGALHVIMTNQLGIKKQAFMMDRDPGPQIWNQPVYGYKTTVLGSAKSDAARGVLIHTTLYYTDELDNSSWTPVVGTTAFAFDKIEMDYTLDLDSAGNIVGGTYSKNSDHPDLFWQPQTAFKLEGDFAKLNNLVQ